MIIRLLILLYTMVLFTACSESLDTYSSAAPLDPYPVNPDTSIIGPNMPPDSGSGDSTITDPSDQIFITDRRGKKWNITHAVENYGFKASRFQYGLGQYKFLPINDPEFLFPGNPGYPSPNNTQQIIGTEINNQQRAYALEDLFFKEIVNDVFGDAHVTIGF